METTDFTQFVGNVSEIPTERISLDDYEKMRERFANRTKGNLTGYDCSECLNRGFFTKYVNHDEQTVECKCMQIRRNYRTIENSGLADVIKQYTFQNFETVDEWQTNAKYLSADYCKNSKDEWFSALGQSGSGKTHLCTAISTHFMKQGRVVKYLLWSDINSKLDSLKFKDEARQDYLDFIRNTDILYIDDFLKTSVDDNHKYVRPPQMEIKNAYDIINARYNAHKKTIISSELHLAELQSIDVAVAGRIKQMCGKYVLSITAEQSRNYRMKQTRGEI